MPPILVRKLTHPLPTAAIYHDEGSRFYTDFDNTFFSSYWLSRNEGGGQTTGNLTLYDIYTTSNPMDGTNSNGKATLHLSLLEGKLTLLEGTISTM